MKTKKLKILVMIGLLLVAISLFPTKSNASIDALCGGYPKEGTITEDSLKDIPDTMNFDMKVDTIDSIEEKVFDKVVENLKAKGITIIKSSNYDELYNKGGLAVLLTPTLNGNYLDKIEISLYSSDGIFFSKEITINWSNKVTSNESDNKSVENLLKELNFTKTDNGIFRYENYFYTELGEMMTDKMEVIQKLKNNEGISLVFTDEDGGAYDYFRGNHTVDYLVFKNNIYYATIEYLYESQTQLTIPDNIEDTDEAYINYALPKIQSYAKNNFIEGNLTITKISGYWYKVVTDSESGLGDDGHEVGNIILKKNAGAYVGNNIYINGLALGTDVEVLPTENSVMENKLKDKGYEDILGAFEFTLKGADKLISPIDITFNVGTGHNGKVVSILHQKKDGSYENFEKTVSNGKITITVSELSPFVLGMKKVSNNNNNNSNVNNNNSSNNSNNTETPSEDVLDDTPKTGVTDRTAYILPITLISAIGIVVVSKKIKKL